MPENNTFSLDSGVSGVRDSVAQFFERYGLAFVLVASYFGSGSIFIASSAGVRYGYTLTWAVIGAVLLGFVGQDMSGRLGIFGEPLMVFTRRKLGTTLATALATVLSLGCVVWFFQLTAAVGKGVAVLLGGAVSWQPLAPLVAGTAIVVGILGYEWVERLLTVMMFGLLVAYVVVAAGSGPSLELVASGFVPQLPAVGALTLIAAILGTTSLWPNFFLESILVEEKGWTDASAIPTMRRDLGLGYAIGGLTTIAIIVASAAVLRPAGITELASFITPGKALAQVLGDWAMVVFLIGAVTAAFNSIIPVGWTPAYLLLQARGGNPDQGDRSFRLIYTVGVALGGLSPLVQSTLGISVVDMVILASAINGTVALPVSAALLFWAVNSETTMGSHQNGRKLNLANSFLVILAVTLAAISARSVYQAVASGGL